MKEIVKVIISTLFSMLSRRDTERSEKKRRQGRHIYFVGKTKRVKSIIEEMIMISGRELFDHSNNEDQTNSISSNRLDKFITRASFLLPNDYVESFRGDLLEKKHRMIKKSQNMGYIWCAIIWEIVVMCLATIKFKLKDIIAPSEEKEINR